MTNIIDIKTARLEMTAKKGYRNWSSRFEEDFRLSTILAQISIKTLVCLAEGKENSTFYLYDLIMNLEKLGSGFEFEELNPKEKLYVLDRHLFLLDRIRFEYMKRLGWLDGYPGEEFTLVELIMRFDELAPGLHATPPILHKDFPAYREYCNMTPFEKEDFIGELISIALKKIKSHSTTL